MGRAHTLLVSVIALAGAGLATAQARGALASAGLATAQNREALANADLGRAQNHEANTYLWAWHGAQDLRGLQEATAGEVGVAYLARTVRVHPNRLVVSPRRSPLRLDPATPRLPVVRIEVEPRVTASDFETQRAAILRAIDPVFAEIEAEPPGEGLQIDFDAPASFRAAYAALLTELRERLPAGRRLEMTALGSWCLQDRWLASVPVDRIVPMLFGPGHEKELTARALRRGPLPERRCNEARGLEEGQRSPRPAPRRYVFPAAGPWDLERAVAVWRARATE